MRTIALNFVNVTPVFLRNNIRAGKPETSFTGMYLNTMTTSGSGGGGDDEEDGEVQTPIPAN